MIRMPARLWALFSLACLSPQVFAAGAQSKPRLLDAGIANPAAAIQDLLPPISQDALRIKKVMRQARGRRRGRPRPVRATPRMAFLAATRRERGANGATPCYTPRPGPPAWASSRAWMGAVGTPFALEK